MKYRILIRNVNINIISFNWLLVGKNPWETDDKQEAVDKFQELLDIYSSGDLTLVQVVPVSIVVTTEESDEEETAEIVIPPPENSPEPTEEP